MILHLFPFCLCMMSATQFWKPGLGIFQGYVIFFYRVNMYWFTLEILIVKKYELLQARQLAD